MLTKNAMLATMQSRPVKSLEEYSLRGDIGRYAQKQAYLIGHNPLHALLSLTINGYHVSCAYCRLFSTFSKNSSPKKLNLPKNSRIFRAKTQQTGSDSSQVNFKTNSIFCIFAITEPKPGKFA